MDSLVNSFLSSLYKSADDSFVGITTFPGPVTKWFDSKDTNKITSYALEKGETCDTYLCVSPRKCALSGAKRGGADDIKYLPCLMLDIDYLSLNHASGNLPPQDKALKPLLDNAPSPSFIFSTGNGYHVYWVFKEAFLIKSSDDRVLAQNVLSGFVSHMQEIYSSFGWMIDSVGDLARMMRFPLTKNFKSKPLTEGELIRARDVRYSIDDFLKFKDEKKVNESLTKVFNTSPKGSAWRVVENCRAIRELKEKPNSVSEPLWMAAGSNIALCPDGREVFHELSKLYDNYSFDETEKKYQHILKANKPCKCSYLSKCTQVCPEGGCGVKAPVIFSILSFDEILDEAMKDEEFNIQKAYDEVLIKAGAKAMEKNPVKYALFKNFLKDKKISVRDWEKTVKKIKENSQKPRKASAAEDFEGKEKVFFPELINESFIVPFGYAISKDKGLEKIKINDYLIEERVTLSFRAVLITKIIKNVDTSELSLELALYMNGEWIMILTPKSVVASKTSIINLANKGLPVTSDNAEEMVKYFARFEEENNDKLKLQRATDRAGWINDEEFYPFVLKDKFISA